MSSASASTEHLRQLLRRFPPISDQVSAEELLVLLGELEQVLEQGVEGKVVEFGCYVGTTSQLITRVLQLRGDKRSFHVYDSFEGLPSKTAADSSPAGEQFKPGELMASKAEFISGFKKAGLPLPRIHKGWFADLAADGIPAKVAFAFLDGDYYESIRRPLDLLAPRLTPGATVVVDDYHNEQLPGAQRAVDEWRERHGHRITSFRVQQSLGIVRLA